MCVKIRSEGQLSKDCFGRIVWRLDLKVSRGRIRWSFWWSKDLMKSAPWIREKWDYHTDKLLSHFLVFLTAQRNALCCFWSLREKKICSESDQADDLLLILSSFQAFEHWFCFLRIFCREKSWCIEIERWTVYLLALVVFLTAKSSAFFPHLCLRQNQVCRCSDWRS